MPIPTWPIVSKVNIWFHRNVMPPASWNQVVHCSYTNEQNFRFRFLKYVISFVHSFLLPPPQFSLTHTHLCTFHVWETEGEKVGACHIFVNTAWDNIYAWSELIQPSDTGGIYSRYSSRIVHFTMCTCLCTFWGYTSPSPFTHTHPPRSFGCYLQCIKPTLRRSGWGSIDFN